MPTIDWPVILSGLLYALITGIFNAIFAHKSQINAWAEANPRLAGLLKITRAIGLDPAHLWAAGALIVKGRLPKVQTEPVDDKLDDTTHFGPVALLLFLGLSVHQQGCASKPLPCDESKLRAIDAAYLIEVGKHCLQYSSAAECPDLPELRAKHSRDLKASCP